jgi:hypothetical protein
MRGDMKKRWVGAGLAAAAVFVPWALVQVTSAGATAKPQQDKSGAITVQAWLYAVPSDNLLSGTVWDCFKITGAINDEGGGPTWTDRASYTAPNTMTSGGATAASKQCGAKEPAGGFILVPPPEPGQYSSATFTATPNATAADATGLTTIYAVHTLTAQKGDIYISYSGTYNFTQHAITVTLPDGSKYAVQPLTAGPEATWVITGGTGAYAGLQGSGNADADAQNTFPWIQHNSWGNVWWSGAGAPATP